MKMLVLCYSLYGHVYRLAQAVADGAKKVEGAEVEIKRVPETLPDDVIEAMGASEFQEKFKKVPVCKPEELAEYDAVVFGTPTRFGNMCGQMRQFMDATGMLWANDSLVGKIGSVFTSSNTQHGGQESTILTFHTTLFHLGMLVAGLPYSFKGQMQTAEISGGSPYGISTVAGGEGERTPTKNELEGARFQGKHVARLAKKLAG